MKKKTVADRLRGAADLFEQRDKEYGSVYKDYGKLMVAYFPDGITLKTEDDFSRFGILNMILSKTNRYAANFKKGGHKDSLSDISVYSQMLSELDDISKE